MNFVRQKVLIMEVPGSTQLGWPAVIANMAFLNVWCAVIPLTNEVSHFTVLFGRQPGSIWVVVA